MHSTEIVTHIRLLFCLIGGMGLGLLAYLDYQSHYQVLAIIMAGVCIVLLLNGLYLLVVRCAEKHNYIEYLFMLLLAAFSYIAAEHHHSQHLYWMYFFPLAAFFFFPMTMALVQLALYIPIALYLVFNFAPTLLQGQLLFSFAAVSSLAFFLASVQSRTNKLLEPLISTDRETGAQLEKFLRKTLSTEITRAEREGTGLMLMYVQLPSDLKRQRRDHQLKNIKACAAAIAQNLRPFDMYFRMPSHHFAIILPHTDSQDTLAIFQRMAHHMPSDIREKIKVGFASLNVGDTADTLINQAKRECKHV